MFRTISQAARGFKSLNKGVQEANRLRTRLIERRLGIDTHNAFWSVDPRINGQLGDSRGFQALHYPLLRRFLAGLELQPDDVAYDIGCGTGRILCAMARMKVRKVVGMDLDPELVEIAKKNAASLRGRQCEIEVYCADACAADYTQGTAFCIFNSFGERTLAAVLEQIRQSLSAHNRPIRFLYINPHCDEVFAAAGWLRRYAESSAILYKTRASYWRHDP